MCNVVASRGVASAWRGLVGIEKLRRLGIRSAHLAVYKASVDQLEGTGSITFTYSGNDTDDEVAVAEADMAKAAERVLWARPKPKLCVQFQRPWAPPPKLRASPNRAKAKSKAKANVGRVDASGSAPRGVLSRLVRLQGGRIRPPTNAEVHISSAVRSWDSSNTE